jgi:large subunit ribosomal protein L33
MAKKNKNILVKLVSSQGTGYFKVKKRNPKTQTEKLSFKKYDPKLRKHVIFKEEKIK